jgi:hypothetical protein
MPHLDAAHTRALDRSTKRRRSRRPALLAALVLAASFVLLSSCQNTDPVAREKARTLTSDERYLVEYYMKVIEFEKHLQDNPATLEEKRLELEKGLDRDRIRRTLAELQKKPERWLAIYNRINELQVRSLKEAPSGQD